MNVLVYWLAPYPNPPNLGVARLAIDPFTGPVYLPIHEWLILMVNVGKYTSPMDPLGMDPLISIDLLPIWGCELLKNNGKTTQGE